ncbi:MAG: ClpXP protease specificity-enhancing factor SspB [Rhizobiaceae bacterium]|nr:ClpXP protease specificity-enhancing factor SspB [Rhizobiaceae bacterium]
MAEEEQPEDLIRYDVLTQEALRDVIRKVLEEVSVAGLPGEHHFFITFRTDHPGVRLSTRMRERYPEEMTIVIQHSFWDLKVSDTGFEIDLSFDDILERLRIPFSSLKGFFDPHVKFGVQFDAEYLEAANADSEERPEEGGEEVENLPQVAQKREITKAKKKPAKAAAQEDVEENETDTSSEGAEVVSLDQFRKKQ